MIHVKGWNCVALVDTGSTNTIMDEITARRILKGKIWEKTGSELITVSGKKPLIGKLSMEGGPITGRTGNVNIYIADLGKRDYAMIVGTDVLQDNDCRIDCTRTKWGVNIGKRRHRIIGTKDIREHIMHGITIRKATSTLSLFETKIRDSYRDVFYKEGEPLTATGRAVHKIETVTDDPVYVKPYRQPFAKLEIIRNHLAEMQKQGVIRESISPYCSPLVLVPKAPNPEGKPQYRLVIDYRELNKRTKTEKHPVPRLDEILDKMTGATIFSTLDLKAGYHQIRLSPRDTEKTAFQFERKKFEFVRMPFGLKNAPTTFQRLMDEFSIGLEDSVQTYMDDILVYSRTPEEHERQLAKLLQRLKEYGLKVSAKKTKFFQTEVRFLGHILSREGVRPDEGKVRAIREMPIPKNVREIRTFLGMVNYYRRFTRDLSELVEPLTKLLKKNVKFLITPEAITSVNKCKEILTTSPVLKYPDFSKPFIITTDASDVAVGAVLSQWDESGGTDHPIEFASKKLAPAETRYSTIERELLGVVWAIEHFRPYVWGVKFAVRTDHMPLVWVHKLKETSARITRWKERLAPYNFDISHTKGTDNAVADCLSRNVNAVELNERTEEQEHLAVRYPRDWTVNGPDLTATEPPARNDDRSIRTMTIEDGIINDKNNQIILERVNGCDVSCTRDNYRHLRTTIIRVGSEININELADRINQVTTIGKTYYIYTADEGLRRTVINLYKKINIAQLCDMTLCLKRIRTVRDETEQRRIVESYHKGITNHRGIQETIAHLHREYYWPGMVKTITQVVRSCEACGRTKYERRPVETTMIITKTPEGPWQAIEMDVFTWGGTKYLTVIDRFSKMAAAKPISSKSAAKVTEAILEIIGQYGRPTLIVTDQGREFRNETITNLLTELGIQHHYTTTGHPRSHGTVERLHNTLTEHLHLINEDRKITGRTAMARAVLAYNNSIHSATGLTPLEGMFRWKRDGKTDRQIQNTLEREKSSRSDRESRTRDNTKYDTIKIGDVVFVENFCKRLKTDPRYLGPYTVSEKLERYRIKLLTNSPRGNRTRIVHVNEVKYRKQNCT